VRSTAGCNRFRLTLVLLAVLLPGVVAVSGETAQAVQRQHLTILHTSDLHGQVLPFDDARGVAHRGSLAQVATVVKRVRAEVDHPVLLLDSGDTIQGAPLEELATRRWGLPSPTIAAMGQIGYEAMAVGNHEFNFGLPLLRRAQEEAAFPFLSANTVLERTGEPAFPPYRVLEKGGVRVGVLGLTTPNVPGWEQPANYAGLRFEPMAEAARRWIAVLRSSERCDLVVVLAHTGFERDLSDDSSNGTEYENYAWRLSRMQGIDVLLTGHTHRLLAPRDLNGVIVAQPPARGGAVIRIDLDLERRDRRWVVAGWAGESLDTRDAAPDAAIEAAAAPLHQRVVAALEQPLGRATAPVSVTGCRIADCAAVDLVHAVQLEASGADLSLASLLTDRTPDLAAGPVNARWVHALYPYANSLVAVRVTGAQVKDILEHTAGYYDGLDCTSEEGCTVLTDPRVRRYNVDTMAGVTYRIDPTLPEGHRILDLAFHGAPIDAAATFTLACNSYRAAGGGGFPHLAEAPVVWRTSAEMTALISDYLTRHDPWRPAADGNWRLVESVTAERQAASGAEENPIRSGLR